MLEIFACKILICFCTDVAEPRRTVCRSRGPLGAPEDANKGDGNDGTADTKNEKNLAVPKGIDDNYAAN